MQYKMQYSSPLGEMLLACDEEGLTGAWFLGQKYFASGLDENALECEYEYLLSAAKWLDIYFSGRDPCFFPKMHLSDSKFRMMVWNELLHIHYGEVCTYGEIARRMGKEKMSAQAVGGAVGHNRISVIIPCHRILGSDGSLTGYAGGTEKKLALLRLEGAV